MSLNENDWILLNAYLDGELASGEQAAFEARLARDPALQAELDLLQQTVALIGMAQRQPVPRSFTLDPKIYGRARSRRASASWLAPALGTAGALLAAGLICGGALVMAAGVGGVGGFGPAAAPAEEEAAEHYEAPMAAEAEGESTEAAELMVGVPTVVVEAVPAEPLAEEAAPAEEEAAAEEAAPAAAEEEWLGTATPGPAQAESGGAADWAQTVPPSEGEVPLGPPLGIGGGGGGGGGEVPPPAATERSAVTDTPSAIPSPTPEELAELPRTELAETGPPAPEELPVRPPSSVPAPTPIIGAVPVPGILAGAGMVVLGVLLMALIIVVWVIRRRR
jgi:hypothetical protein